MKNFVDAMSETLNSSKSNLIYTENGALGYKTTGKALLDLNFEAASMRNWADDDISAAFAKVFAENPALAVNWLFFARDCRGGMGERRLFRVCFRHLAENHPEMARKTLRLIPEYGRWDDLWCLLDTKLAPDVVSFVQDQIEKDLDAVINKQSCSLLGKWMPSINSHAPKTRKLALKLMTLIELDQKMYQNVTSTLRKAAHIVERDMSANRWGDIRYEAVPSKANVNYRNAFLEHDGKRRRAYLEDVKNGKAKMNASVLFPHDIFAQYRNQRGVDDTLEEAWKALPDYVGGDANTLVVSDGSGSMHAKIGATNVEAWDVSAALAIYFAERLSGPFHNTYVTFSQRPSIVHFNDNSTLREKIAIARRHNDWTNTDIAKTFRLILNTAVKNNCSQEDLPKTVLIISDMEFDPYDETDGSLFDKLADEFKEKGYLLPRLAFWNVASRSGAIPMTENENGVVLVSGFSPAIAEMVLSEDVDPLVCLMDMLMKERYAPVREALK